MKKVLSLLMLVVVLVTAVSCSAKEITRGTVDGNVYKSDFTGITFTKPDSWTFSSDEEIAEVMEVAADELLDENYADTVADLTTVFDMMAVDASTGTNVNITYENLAKTGNEKLTADEYLDLTVEQLTSQTAMSTSLTKEDKATLCGEEYIRATFTTSYSGVSMTQVYYLRKIDNYMVNIVVTLVGNTTIADVEAMFS